MGESVRNVACVRVMKSAENSLSPKFSLRARVSHVSHSITIEACERFERAPHGGDHRPYRATLPIRLLERPA
jgi:hypothetical protein